MKSALTPIPTSNGHISETKRRILHPLVPKFSSDRGRSLTLSWKWPSATLSPSFGQKNHFPHFSPGQRSVRNCPCLAKCPPIGLRGSRACVKKCSNACGKVKVGGDYSEGIKVRGKKENVEKSKSGNQQKKGFGGEAFKKLNRQGGCGFWGTIGCNRSMFELIFVWLLLLMHPNCCFFSFIFGFCDSHFSSSLVVYFVFGSKLVLIHFWISFGLKLSLALWISSHFLKIITCISGT